MRWAVALLVALATWLPASAAAEGPAPAVEPLAVELTLRPDGGVDGQVRATWRAGAAPVEGVWKTLGHGARVRSVVDAESGQPLAYSSAVAVHESRVEVRLDRPIQPGQTRAIAIQFDQTHVWHYDRATRTLTLNVPWVMSWEVGVRDAVHRVHVPEELGPMPEPNGWAVEGRTLVARRAEGAPRLTMQAAVAPEAIGRWTAPLLARVPASAWLGLVLLLAAPVAWRWRPRRRPVGPPELDAAAAAALLAPGDDRVLVEAGLLTLVERGAVALRETADGDVEAVEQPGRPLDDVAERWREVLLAGAAAGPDGRRRARLSEAIARDLHRAWRREVERDLGRRGLLEAEQSPGLGGLSYAGWAARERLRREMRAEVGGPGVGATVALTTAALAIGLGAGALATVPGRIELDSQQYAIGTVVFDGTSLVRLRYTLARLLPLPSSHEHDYAQDCGNGCGQGYFVGDHACASSCGGVA